MVNARDKLRALVKVLLSALPLGLQTIPAVGFMGPMVIPLLFYFLAIPFGSDYIWEDFLGIWRINNFVLLGAIIFYIGLTIFCLALLQWVWCYHKNLGLFERGLYSKTRHPQFLGIIIMTLGLTVKLNSFGGWGLVGVPFLHSVHLGLSELVGLWFLQVLGYVAVALYEERHLSKKFSEYKEYKQRVPLLLPIKNPKVIPEILFTVLLVVGICVVFYLLPYGAIGLYFYRHLPPISFP